ncbi:Protein FAM92A1 [Trichoplax sp. H2]|nr:Protein FAM92A1 [Trichoplax sp. H2]|eukprot:RDD37582.1 Protein FAM92A1 [Trichoplax sp. H2]
MSSFLDTPGSPTNKRERANRDAQFKFLSQRITRVEKHLAIINQRFQVLATKTGRLKLRSELVAKAVNDYADEESISIKNGLRGFVDCFLALQSHMQAHADHIENKVIEPFSRYSHTCRHMKEDLKNGFTARDKLLAKEKQLERIKGKEPANKSKILESDTSKIRDDAEKQTKSLEEEMDNFEKEKIRDIKIVFGNYIHGAMHYHAKALEVLTLADQYIANINEEEDLEEFRNMIQANSLSPRLDITKAHSTTSLNATETQGRIEDDDDEDDEG